MSDDSEEDAESFCIGFSPVVTHTITFKCIGSNNEKRYQETLARVAQLRNGGQDVS